MSLNLVNYSDSSSDDEQIVQNDEPAPKRCKLPNPFEKSKEISAQDQDDSINHDGRIRNFPHERGNWPTYVYIQYPNNDLVRDLREELLTLIKSSVSDDVKFHTIDDLHISLTRTVVLQHHWINEFVRSIETRLKNAKRFQIDLDTIEIYCNDNRSRTFISLSLEDETNGKQCIHNLVKQLDICLEEFKLETFYQEASYHVSLFWCLGDRKKQLESLRPQLNHVLKHLSSKDGSELIIDVQKLFCKIGNKLYSFQL